MHASVLVGLGIPGARVLGWVSPATATAKVSRFGIGILGVGNYIREILYVEDCSWVD